MKYELVKPEIGNIFDGIWEILKVRWLFWVLFVATAGILGLFLYLVFVEVGSQAAFGVNFLLSLLFLFICAFAIIFTPIALYYEQVEMAVRKMFWVQLAQANNWEYVYDFDFSQENAVMFQQGYRKHISHYIRGVIDNRPFRAFNYNFSVGSERYSKYSQRTYEYTVFAFRFEGVFPHAYLNSSHNKYSISAGEKIPLASEFEKKYSLSAPKDYEIEALEIFTPDILVKLIDGGYIYDVEFIDNEMFVFIDGTTNTFELLKTELSRVLELVDLFDNKLDAFKFHKIGDMSYHLE